MLTKMFDFHIDPTYFPGYTVKGPVYARVWYEVSDTHEVLVTKIGFPFAALAILCINENLLMEIKEAAYNNHQK